MKPFMKPILLALGLSGMACVSVIAQPIKDGALIGPLLSTSFFGEYQGTLTGSYEYPSFEMSAFPNGYVQGSFGPGSVFADGKTPTMAWGGWMNKSGFFQGTFEESNFTLLGTMDTRNHTVFALLLDGRNLLGVVRASPESWVDFAPAGPTLNLPLYMEDENTNSFHLTLYLNGTFTSDMGVGTYKYKKSGKNMGKITLTFSNREASPLTAKAKPTHTTTFIIFYTDSDVDDVGVIYDVQQRKFYNWTIPVPD
jgi:hypothetical protein